MLKRLIRIGAVLTISTFALLLSPLYDVNASPNDTDARENVSKVVSDMESVMMRSYNNEAERLSELASKGYDYDLTSQSFYSQGLPFSNYDYLEFIAAYSTIQNYCIENGINMDGGINKLDFVNLEYEDATEKEYVSKKIDKYVENGDGTYRKDGYTYIMEPCDVTTYQADDNGNYVKKDKEHIDLETKDVRYASVTLTTIEPEQIYETFGLNREDFKEEEKKRLEKLNEIMGKGDIGQTIFIESSTLMTDEQKQIAENAIKSSDTDQQKEIISIATSIVGKVPYEWGGKSDKAGFDDTWYTFDATGRQKGLDCSGYVQWVLRTANFEGWEELGSTGADLGSSRLRKITSDELIPGDLGFLYPTSTDKTNHVGIYLGDGKWIHCSSSAKTVTISDNVGFAVFRRFLDADTKLEVAAQNKDIVAAGVEAETQEPASVEEVKTETTSEVIPEVKAEAAPEVTPKVIISPDVQAVNVTTDVVPDAAPVIPTVNTTDNNLMLMAKIVQLESLGEGYNGWVAVAQVIRNRIVSNRFPNSIVGVVSAPKQFATYRKASRMSDTEVNQDIYKVCESVMAGNLKVIGDDVIGFKRNDGSTTWNGWRLNIVLGNHAFYTF